MKNMVIPLGMNWPMAFWMVSLRVHFIIDWTMKNGESMGYNGDRTYVGVLSFFVLLKALKLGHYIRTISIFGFKFDIFWHSDYITVMSNITHMVLGLPWHTSRLFWRESLAMRPSSQGKIGIGPWLLIFHLCAYTDYIYIYHFLVCIHVHVHIYAYPQSSIRNAAQLNWDWPWPSPDWWVLTTPPTLAPNMSKATEVSGGEDNCQKQDTSDISPMKKRIP